MESLDVRKQLDCPCCRKIYSDPVTLKCGHSFCRVCVEQVLDNQQWSSVYSCPVCGEKSAERPALHKNLVLHNMAENCREAEAQEQKQQRTATALDEDTKNKIFKLKSVLKRLETERNETSKRAQSLDERQRKTEVKAADETGKAHALFRDIRRQLDDLEKKVVGEISLQVEQLSTSLTKLCQRLTALEFKLIEQQHNIGYELSEIVHKLTPDMLAEIERSDKGEEEEDGKRSAEQSQDVGDLDMTAILLTLHTGLSDIIYSVSHAHLHPSAGPAPQPHPTLTAQQPGLAAEEDLILDIDTASFQLHISDDRKSAARPTNQIRPDSPDRFWTFPQVLSTRTFSSGRHSWEVDIGGIDWCCIAMCYPSMDRNGRKSKMEDNSKAWCLVKLDNKYFMKHNWKEVRPPVQVSSNKIRISLDYEAGQISFFELCDPIRLLHTFTTTFTEPLHAALGVYREVGCMKIAGYNREM